MNWKQRKPITEFQENDSILERLAKINGINDVEMFLSPSAKDINSSNKLQNINEAVDLIKKHALLKTKIVIFYDADQDGCESGAIMYRYLRNFTDNLETIHVQRKDGHGLHLVEDQVPVDTGLLIVLDSSTNESESCNRISEKGIPILIIDHHDFEGVENPYAIIVNPKMPGCSYPNKEMSGALTTLKVCMALDDYFSSNYAESLIDLAGFSLLADVMSSLEPENRYYIKYALDNPLNLGMRVLLESLKINIEKLDSTQFLFSVSPCITAITRLGKLEKAFKLLISDDPVECEAIAKEIVRANEYRKQLQREAIELVRNQIDLNDKCIVIVEPSIGKSFNGVVAQSIASQYQRPTIVLGESEGESDQLSGSFRSYGGFDLKKFLKSVRTSLYAEGHGESGGTGCKKEKLQQFKDEINKGLQDVQFEQSIVYDLEIEFDDVTEKLISEVKRFYRIAGKGLSEAKFLIKDVFSIDKKSLGKMKDTLKTGLCSASETWFIDESEYDTLEPKVDGLKFRTTEEYITAFPVHKSVDVIGSLSLNEWFNPKQRKVIKTKQIFIEDYRITQ